MSAKVDSLNSTMAQRPENRPRGFYTVPRPWTKDTTKKYFKGAKNKVIFPLIKLALVFLIWALMYNAGFSKTIIFATTLALILSYQHVVAAVCGIKVMPAMDQACFISTSKSHINYVSVSYFDGTFSCEGLKKIYSEKFISHFEKFRYKVVYRFGDIYYDLMTPEEALEKSFTIQTDPDKIPKTQREIDMYVEDNINEKIPLDGPQWQCQPIMYKSPADGKTYMI